MPKGLEVKGLRPDVVTALDELRDAAEQKIQDAQAIDALAEEQGRGLTDEESTQIETLMAESIALTEQYDERLKEEQRAVARATIELGQERVAALPEATMPTSNSSAARRVRNMRSMFYEDRKRGFSNLGDFCATVWSTGYPGAAPDERLGKIQVEAAATGMSQGVGADGGALVPPEFRETIWLGMQQEVSNLFALTDQYPVTGESITFPASAETSRATGSRWGGVRGYWLAEADQITASKPKVRQMKLEPQELAVLVYVTDKLLRNASALDAYVTRASTEEITFLINDAIINGNGVGQPLGVLNGGGLVTVAKEAGQAADTVVLENVNNMWSRMHANARAGSAWLINQDIEPQLEALSAVVGTGGFPVYLPQGAAGPTITEAPNARLKGRPVIPVEYCQTLGTEGDIILMNPAFYATGLQGGLREDMSIHLRFDYAETAFRFMFSVDGQPWMNSALTPKNGTNTLSAYVSLATRA